MAVDAVFVRRQQKLADPLIDLRLFRAPAFSASLAAKTLALFAMLGTELFIAQCLQLVLGMGPLEAGLWTLPSACPGREGRAYLSSAAHEPRQTVVALAPRAPVRKEPVQDTAAWSRA